MVLWKSGIFIYIINYMNMLWVYLQLSHVTCLFLYTNVHRSLSNRPWLSTAHGATSRVKYRTPSDGIASKAHHISKHTSVIISLSYNVIIKFCRPIPIFKKRHQKETLFIEYAYQYTTSRAQWWIVTPGNIVPTKICFLRQWSNYHMQTKRQLPTHNCLR